MVMADNKNNNERNVPHLRFPEFSGEWDSFKLVELGKFIGGGTPSSSNLSFWTGSIPWISSSDIKEDNINNISISRYITEEAIEKSATKYCPAPVILIVSRVGVGKVALSHTSLCTSQDFCNIIEIKCHPVFLSYNLLRTMKRKSREVQGTSIKGITSDELQKMRVFIPKNKDEQNKISNLLTLLDERIATQNKIIEDLKKLKSAIIDQLYSAIKGKGYSYRQIFEIVNERNKQLEYSNILSASQEKGMVNREDLNLDIQFERSNINTYKVVRKGDYVIHLRSFQGGYAFSDKIGVCSPAYTILRPNDLLEFRFLSYYFTSQKFIKSLIIVTYGIRDGRSINVEEWLDMKTTIPQKEQQRHIVDTIRNIEKKIENEELYASYLSKQKQYLLRQLFI
ncbi:restriction endonuclease subunit S [Bacteroides fragilis]|nr:restriction endonuclease subunit S [Bacteroides fragilis]